MSTSDMLDLFSEDTAEALGLFTMKNTRESMKRIRKNQKDFIELFLSSHDDTTTESTDEKRVYDMKDIQRILGISKTTAYALVKQAPFRVVHIGNAIRISKADFDRWLDDSEQNKGGF